MSDANPNNPYVLGLPYIPIGVQIHPHKAFGSLGYLHSLIPPSNEFHLMIPETDPENLFNFCLIQISSLDGIA